MIIYYNRDFIIDIYLLFYVDRDGNVWLMIVGRIDIFSFL